MKRPKIQSDLIPLAEAAELLGKSKQTIRNWLTAGRLTRCKLGGATYIRVEEVEKLMKEAFRGSRGPVRKQVGLN